MHADFHIRGRDRDLESAFVVDSKIEVERSAARGSHDHVGNALEQLIDYRLKLVLDQKIQQTVKIFVVEQSAKRHGIHQFIRNKIENCLRNALYAADKAAEIDHHVAYRRNVHTLAVHVEDAPRPGRTDVTAAVLDDLAVGVAVGDDHRADTVLDACDFLIDYAEAAAVGRPSDCTCRDEPVDLIGLIQFEVEYAFRLHNAAGLLVEVGDLSVGVGVALIEEQSDDDGDGHSARGGVEDHAVVKGKVAVVLEACIVVEEEFADPLIAHTLFDELSVFGIYDLRNGVAHADTRRIAYPLFIGIEQRIGYIRHDVLVVDELEEFGVIRTGFVVHESVGIYRRRGRTPSYPACESCGSVRHVRVGFQRFVIILRIVVAVEEVQHDELAVESGVEFRLFGRKLLVAHIFIKERAGRQLGEHVG